MTTITAATYVISPPRHTDGMAKVHLVHEGDTYTVCGRKLNERWTMADDTISGRQATCGTCRAVFVRRSDRALAMGRHPSQVGQP